MRMRHIVICGLPRSTIFFHFIPQTARFSEKKSFNTRCVLLFSPHMSEIFLILGKIKRDMIKDVYWSSCKVPIIPVF